MCAIEDGYHALLRDDVAAADALVYATPLYWYGIAAVLKVARDPSDPLGAARDLGRRIFELRYSDFRVDTERPNAVWGADAGVAGVYEDV